MDYEEKYEQALERAKEIIAKEGSFVRVTPVLIESIFPELAESEDERIRKALLNEFIHLQSKGYKFAGLEGEVESYWKQCDLTWCRDAYTVSHIRIMLSDVAKYFYELGLKAQKGE